MAGDNGVGVEERVKAKRYTLLDMYFFLVEKVPKKQGCRRFA
jgi:hypothetical protein